MENHNNTMVNLQLKIEEKLNTLSDKQRLAIKEITDANEILKTGRSLDYHLIQKLICWHNGSSDL